MIGLANKKLLNLCMVFFVKTNGFIFLILLQYTIITYGDQERNQHICVLHPSFLCLGKIAESKYIC